MNNYIAFALSAVGFLLLGYALWSAFKSDLAEKDEAHDRDTAALCEMHSAAIAWWRRQVTNWEATAEVNNSTINAYKRLRDNLIERNRDLRNQLVVEQARADWSEQELARIAEQVAGKCLWPTLAEDDVVVQSPKARA